MKECPSKFDCRNAAEAFAEDELPEGPEFRIDEAVGGARILVFTDDTEVRDALEELGYTVRERHRISQY